MEAIADGESEGAVLPLGLLLLGLLRDEGARSKCSKALAPSEDESRTERTSRPNAAACLESGAKRLTHEGEPAARLRSVDAPLT